MGKAKPLSAKQKRVMMVRYAEHYKSLLEQGGNILGIDLSISGTACVWRSGEFKKYVPMSVDTSKEVSVPAKLDKINKEVYEFGTFRCPDLVVFEDVNVMAHISGLIAVSSAKGATLSAVQKSTRAVHNTTGPIYLAAVNKTIKKCLTGSGGAEKSDMIQCAEDLSGCDLLEDDNKADAVGAAYCGVVFLRFLQAVIDADLGELPYDEMNKAVRDLIKSESQRHPAHEVEVGVSMLQSKKSFKENFGQYQREKIRKELKGV